MLKHPDQIKMLEVSEICKFKQNNPIGNYLGIMGEFSEFVQACIDVNREEFEDAIIDIYVFLLNLSNDLNISIPVIEPTELPNTEEIDNSIETHVSSFIIHAGNLGSLLGKHKGYIKTKPSDTERNFLKEIDQCLLIVYRSLVSIGLICDVDISSELDKVIQILKERHVVKTINIT